MLHHSIKKVEVEMFIGLRIKFCASTVDLSRAKVDDSRPIFRTKKKAKIGGKDTFLIKNIRCHIFLFDSLESDNILKHTLTKYHVFSVANWFSSI